MRKRNVIAVISIVFLATHLAVANNQAGLVIKNSTGEVISRCVEFEEDVLTVEKLIKRSGFKQVLSQSSFGASICFLHDDGVGDAENCFNDPRGYFWNFMIHENGEWASASVGISTATAVNGSLFGFAYGAWGEVELPPLTFNDVCGFTSKAAVVIDHGDGRRVINVVEFPGETQNGLHLLQQSGLDLVIQQSSFGPAICSIDGEGQPADNCFGDPEGRFWNFSILDENDQWMVASVGVNEIVVRDGDVHGYRWGLWGEEQAPITRNEIFDNPTGIPFWQSYELMER